MNALRILVALLFLTQAGSAQIFSQGGGGGTPGGSNQQLQYNNSGAFGGIAGSTWDGTTLTLPGFFVTKYNTNFGYKAYQGRSAAGITRSTTVTYFAPMIIEGSITIDKLGTGVSTTSAGGNFQLAIYNNVAATCRPGTEIAHSASGSTATATGVAVTLNSNAVLTPGIYWLGLQIDNATAVTDGLDDTFSLMN